MPPPVTTLEERTAMKPNRNVPKITLVAAATLGLFASMLAALPAQAADDRSDLIATSAVETAEAALGLTDDTEKDTPLVLNAGDELDLRGSDTAVSVVMGAANEPDEPETRYTSDQLDGTTTRVAAVLASPKNANPSWTFDEGTELYVLPDGRVSVADADGNLLAGIAAPWAIDAGGQRVETTYTAEGNVLTQHVEVNESTTFPVVADPTFTVFPGYWTATLNRSESAAAVGTVGSCAAVFSKSPVPALRALTVACGALAAFSTAQLAGGKCVKVHVAGLPPVVATWWPTFPKC